MLPRDRVLCALDHQEPDRVPIFFGTSGVTTMLAPAYEQLKAHLGLRGKKPRLLSKPFQYARLDEEVMLRMGSDGRPLLPGPAPSTLRRQESNGRFVDAWGIEYENRTGSPYYEYISHPLRDASVDDLSAFPWPDLTHPSRFVNLAEEAFAAQAAGYATVLMSGVSPFEQAQGLRGIATFLLDLALNPEFASALLGKLTDLTLAGAMAALDVASDDVDIVLIGDDLGSQNAPLISPQMYRTIIKPCHARIIAAIKDKVEAKVFFHSDGNIYPLLNDLIEIGVDIINPVQVSAADMGDTARLKREFGDRLSFNGAIDTQRVLPRGTPEDVRQEVRRRIKDLAPGGGYICSAVHCIQPDVPPENVCAMFDEAVRAGEYPLRL